MTDVPALAAALVALAAALTAAVLRPRLEWAIACAGALILLAVGAVSASHGGAAIRELAPTVGFLAALLVLAEGCRREGLFTAVGALLARGATGVRGGGATATRLLGLVFAVASATTIVLGLDATVVLLTPVVLLTVRRLRVDVRGPAYACAHLANSASLLLPVSNLTNLLAFRASGLSFTRFALLMALPTAAAIAVEWVVLRRWVGAQAGGAGDAPGAGHGPVLDSAPLPRFPLVVLAATLAGFAFSSALGIAPAWMAVAGAAAITAPALARRDRTLAADLVRAVQPGFLLFVLALAVIVAAAGDNGLTSAIAHVLPSGASLGALMLTAAIAAALANLVNNLPATLILVPVAAPLGVGPVLAVLVGVNIGPNLTEAGSLATLLWRRILRAHGVELSLSEFTRLGAITVPAGLVAATVALWLALQIF